MPNIRTTSVAVMVDREVERNSRVTSVALLVDLVEPRDIQIDEIKFIFDAIDTRNIQVTNVCLVADIDYNPGTLSDLLNQNDYFAVEHYAPEPSNGHSTLVNELSAEALTFEVADGSVFPSAAPFDISIHTEIIRVTRNGNILKTAARPSGAIHGSGSTVTAILTAEGIYQKTPYVAPIADLTGGSWINQETATFDGRTFRGGTFTYTGIKQIFYYKPFSGYPTDIIVQFRPSHEQNTTVSSALAWGFGLYDSVAVRSKGIELQINNFASNFYAAFGYAYNTNLGTRSDQFRIRILPYDIYEIRIKEADGIDRWFLNGLLINTVSRTKHYYDAVTVSPDCFIFWADCASSSAYHWSVEILRCEGL